MSLLEEIIKDQRKAKTSSFIKKGSPPSGSLLAKIVQDQRDFRQKLQTTKRKFAREAAIARQSAEIIANDPEPQVGTPTVPESRIPRLGRIDEPTNGELKEGIDTSLSNINEQFTRLGEVPVPAFEDIPTPEAPQQFQPQKTLLQSIIDDQKALNEQPDFGQAPDAEKESSLEEIATTDRPVLQQSGNLLTAGGAGLLRGITTELPDIFGRAIKFLGFTDTGDGLIKFAEDQSKKMWKGDVEFTGFAKWVNMAMSMLPTSVIPGGVAMTGAKVLLKVGKLGKFTSNATGIILKQTGKAQQLRAAGRTTEALKHIEIAKNIGRGKHFKGAKATLKKANKNINRITASTVGSLFGLAQAGSTKEAILDRIDKLELQGKTEEANALKRTLWYAPLITGAIEGMGETIGAFYLARLFNVPVGQIVARTSRKFVIDHLKSVGKIIPVEVGTEVGQQVGELGVEKALGIRPEAKIFEGLVDTMGAVTVMTMLMGGAGGLSNFSAVKENVARDEQGKAFRKRLERLAIVRKGNIKKLGKFLVTDVTGLEAGDIIWKKGIDGEEQLLKIAFAEDQEAAIVEAVNNIDRITNAELRAIEDAPPELDSLDDRIAKGVAEGKLRQISSAGEKELPGNKELIQKGKVIGLFGLAKKAAQQAAKTGDRIETLNKKTMNLVTPGLAKIAGTEVQLTKEETKELNIIEKDLELGEITKQESILRKKEVGKKVFSRVLAESEAASRDSSITGTPQRTEHDIINEYEVLMPLTIDGVTPTPKIAFKEQIPNTFAQGGQPKRAAGLRVTDTGRIIVINPFTGDRWFLDEFEQVVGHEVAHALFTDAKVWQPAIQRTQAGDLRIVKASSENLPLGITPQEAALTAKMIRSFWRKTPTAYLSDQVKPNTIIEAMNKSLNQKLAVETAKANGWASAGFGQEAIAEAWSLIQTGGQIEAAARKKNPEGMKLADQLFKDKPSIKEVRKRIAKVLAERKAETKSRAKPKVKSTKVVKETEDEQHLKALSKMADLQRDKPEHAMLRVQHSQISQLYGFVAEAAGDISHRIFQELSFFRGLASVDEKLKRVQRTLTDPFGFEKEFKQQIVKNLKFEQDRGNLLNETVESQTAKLRELSQKYADAHKALPELNEAQRLAKEVAIAVGEWRFDDAIKAVETLQEKSKDKDKWFKFITEKPTVKKAKVKAEAAKTLVSEKTEINEFSGENEFLSNFAATPIIFKGKQYPTLEHAYQAEKSTSNKERKAIREASTPGKAKRLGRATKSKRPDFDKNKEALMLKLLRIKFKKNSALAAQLTATGNANLVEGNRHHDNFFGDCKGSECAKIKGQNKLGKLLMKIRSETKTTKINLVQKETKPTKKAAPKKVTDLPEHIQEAVKRRNIDFINGQIKLPNGDVATATSIDKLIKVIKKREEKGIPRNSDRTKSLTDEQRLKRLQALPDNASVIEVRKAEEINDSRTVTKAEGVRIAKHNIADRKQYIADLKATKEFLKPPKKISLAQKGVDETKEKAQFFVRDNKNQARLTRRAIRIIKTRKANKPNDPVGIDIGDRGLFVTIQSDESKIKRSDLALIDKLRKLLNKSITVDIKSPVGKVLVSQTGVETAQGVNNIFVRLKSSGAANAKALKLGFKDLTSPRGTEPGRGALVVKESKPLSTGGLTAKFTGRLFTNKDLRTSQSEGAKLIRRAKSGEISTGEFVKDFMESNEFGEDFSIKVHIPPHNIQVAGAVRVVTHESRYEGLDIAGKGLAGVTEDAKKDPNKTYFYHFTLPDRVASIKKHGLKSKMLPQFSIMANPGREGQVFVSNSLEKALRWADVLLEDISSEGRKLEVFNRKAKLPKTIFLLEIAVNNNQSNNILFGNKRRDAKPPAIKVQRGVASPVFDIIALTPAQKKEGRQIVRAAIKKYGRTPSSEEAGYILPNGEMLDFKRDGDFPIAHDDVENLKGIGSNAPSDEFINKTGAIRIDHKGTHVGITIPINIDALPDKQLAQINKALRRHGGIIGVDFNDARGFPSVSRDEIFLISDLNSLFKQFKRNPDKVPRFLPGERVQFFARLTPVGGVEKESVALEPILAPFKIPASRKVGQPLPREVTEGICIGTCGIVTKRLKDEGNTYGRVWIHAKSPIGNWNIGHVVAITEIDGERFIVNMPQGEFLGTNFNIDNVWEELFHPLEGNIKNHEELQGIRVLHSAFGEPLRNILAGKKTFGTSADVIEAQGKKSDVNLIENVKKYTEDKVKWTEGNIKGSKTKIRWSKDFDDMQVRFAEAPTVFTNQEFTPRLIAINEESIMKSYGVSRAIAQENIRNINKEKLISGTEISSDRVTFTELSNDPDLFKTVLTNPKKSDALTVKRAKALAQRITVQSIIENPGLARVVRARPTFFSPDVIKHVKKHHGTEEQSAKTAQKKAESVDESIDEDLTDGGEINDSQLPQKKGKRGTKVSKRRGTPASDDVRQHQMGVTPEQKAVLQGYIKALKLNVFETETVGSWMQAAKEMGMDLPQLLKSTADPENLLNKKQVIALTGSINATVKRMEKARKMFDKFDKTDPIKAAAWDKAFNQEEALLKNALSNQIRGLTEVARSMRAAQLMAQANNLDPAFWIRRAQRELGRKITDAQFAEIVLTIQKISEDGTPLDMAEFIQTLKKPSLTQKLIALWKAGLLTSFKTHTANMTGTGIMSVLETVSDIPATGIDILVAMATGKRTVTISQRTVLAKLRGIGIKVKFVNGVPKFTLTKEGALRTAGRFFKTGVYSDELLDKYDLPRSIEFEKFTFLNTYMKGVFRSLGAEDIFFREIAMMESLEKQAIVIAINRVREGSLQKENMNRFIGELLQNPTIQMQAQAINTAARVTFQNPNIVSEMITRAKSVSKKKEGQFETESKRFKAEMLAAGIDIIAPFVRTPTNIAFRILDLSPVGFLKAAIRAASPRIRKSLLEAEIEGKPGLQQVLIEDIARGITGTSVIAVGFMLASSGLMVGNAPEDQGERDQFFLEGKKPNSALLGGAWRSMNRISPFGNLLGVGVELYNNWAEGKDIMGISVSTGLDAAKMISEQTFLQGVSGILKALNDPDRFADAYANRMVGSMIPSIFNTAARVVDPIQRVPERGLIGLAQSFFYSRTPWLSKKLAMRVDAFGNPVIFPSAHSKSIFKRAIALAVDPIPGSKALQHPLLDEAKRIGVNIDVPSKTISSIRLTNAEWEKFQKHQGTALEKYLTYTVRTSQYQKAEKLQQRKIWKKAERVISSNHNAVAFPALMIKRYNLDQRFAGKANAEDPYFKLIRKVLGTLGSEPRFRNASTRKQRVAVIKGLRQLGINHPL